MTRDEPVTKAGKQVVNDVREVVVHGVTDRIRLGFDLAWTVARGVAQAEREAVEAYRRERPEPTLPPPDPALMDVLTERAHPDHPVRLEGARHPEAGETE